MPIGQEFELLRRQVQEYSRKQHEEYLQRRDQDSKLPDGFFTASELQLFEETNRTIDNSVNEAMADMEIVNFRLKRSFIPKSKGGSLADFLVGMSTRGIPKQIEYELQFREDPLEENWDENKEYESVCFTFIPKKNKPVIIADGTLPLKKEDEKKYHWGKRIKVREAMKFLREEADKQLVRYLPLEVEYLDQEEIKNLILILLADPNRIAPR